MEDFYSDQSKQQTKPQEVSQTMDEFDAKRETPEEIVAQNVSQQLLSNAFEFQKHERDSEQMVPTFGEPIIEEPIHQNVDIQSEQRFSGIPIQQYIYDEEEEDEEESDPEDDFHPMEKYGKAEAKSYPMSGSNDKTENTDNLFELSSGGQQKTSQSSAEILYQLSDDNVLTAQSYGIGSDLRIGSTASESNSTELSAYELNSEDPFSTPQKHKTDINRKTEEDFERFVEKCEPFETIANQDQKPKESIDLLDLDQSMGQTTKVEHQIQVVPKESHHSLVESRPDSQFDTNHALSAVVSHIESDKGPEVVPSSAFNTSLNESHIQSIPSSTNRSDTDFNPTLSPNLDCFEPTLTSSTHHFEQAFPSEPVKSYSSDPIKTIEEQKISQTSGQKQTSKGDEPKEESIPKKMPKRESPQKEHAVNTSTDEGNNCPFSPSEYFLTFTTKQSFCLNSFLNWFSLFCFELNFVQIVCIRSLVLVLE